MQVRVRNGCFVGFGLCMLFMSQAMAVDELPAVLETAPILHKVSTNTASLIARAASI
jgi:hypothetical protein